MKKFLPLACLLLIIALALVGCSAPEPNETEPSPEPTVTATPWVAPKPDPTVTPRVMEGVMDPEATPLTIDPIDKPTWPPILFEYTTVTESALGVSFDVPTYWVRAEDPTVSNAIVYEEPQNDIRSGTGTQSQVVIQVVRADTAQTIKDAEAYIDLIIENLWENKNFQNTDFSQKADNRMLGETGRYITYRLDYMPEGAKTPVRMRGRILVVPVDRKLYMVRYMCPAEFNVMPTDDPAVNGGYEEVYKKIRSTLKDI